jgi:hypothetical protein
MTPCEHDIHTGAMFKGAWTERCRKCGWWRRKNVDEWRHPTDLDESEREEHDVY